MPKGPATLERKRLAVDAAHDGARLDVFLAAHVPALSRSRLHDLISEGRVLVEGSTRKPSARVHRGQEVVLEIPPPEEGRLQPEVSPLAILYEDRDVLVLNKPAGLPVHPGPGHPSGTLANAILAHAPDLAGVGGELRPGIVHRLDKDTSGVLVVAKHDTALRALQEQIKARTASRLYLAVVHGRVAGQEGDIEASIGRHPRHRKRMSVVARGRFALTRYRVMERFPRATLVEARLVTGRTHQVRVHFAHIGHPVVGDPVYAGRRERYGMTRQALHAFRLTFVHPTTGKEMTLEAELPEDMRELLEHLRA